MGGDIMRFDLMNYSSSMPLAFCPCQGSCGGTCAGGCSGCKGACKSSCKGSLIFYILSED